jgi:predicted nucleic acid-binding protein
LGLTFLDSCTLIYAVEDSGSRGETARARLGEITEREFTVSPLVRLECLFDPLRRGAHVEAARFRGFLSLFKNARVDDATFDLATHIRAIHGLKTAHAIHVATAHLNDCDEIWTNDGALLRAAPNIAVNIFATP